MPEETKHTVSVDIAEMVGQLTRLAAFPFPLSESTLIAVLHTHASAVVLTPNCVYKLKKPKNFGFFDYSTPLLRQGL